MYLKFKWLGGAVLGMTTALWTAAPVLAQHGGGGAHGGGGGHASFGSGHGSFGGRGFDGGRGTGRGFDHDRGFRGGYGGYYPGLYVYGSYPYYGYADSYGLGDYGYSAYPYDGYGDSAYQAEDYGYSTQPDSGWAGFSWGTSVAPLSQDERAQVRVIVPPDAHVWVQNQATSKTGSIRDFVSPLLEPSRNYTYDVRARWNEGGQEVEQTRTVEVHAGGQTTVDFRALAPGQPPTPANTAASGSWSSP
jgi:uncharacterized protein (TIGR03000 family)